MPAVQAQATGACAGINTVPFGPRRISGAVMIWSARACAFALSANMATKPSGCWLNNAAFANETATISADLMVERPEHAAPGA